MPKPILDASEERAVAGVLLTGKHRKLVNDSIPASLRDGHDTLQKWARYNTNSVYYVAAFGAIMSVVAIASLYWGF